MKKLSGVHDVKGGRTATTATLWQLSIVRGLARFPTLPLDHAEYLIGSSPICDLQLATHFPEFSAVILTEDGGAEIFSASERVQISLNGKPTTQSELQSGDLVALNELEFMVKRSERASSVVQPAGYTANELVDRMAADLKLMTELESDQQADRYALLMEEIQQRQARTNWESPPGGDLGERTAA